MQRAVPLSSRAVRTLAAALIGLTAFAAAAAAATFDLAPSSAAARAAWPMRPSSARCPRRSFAEPGTLTIGVAPSLPPISSYATDARTVIGFDADVGQLVSDSLGRKLKIVALAWADWPLALESGKVDAVISNVTVTEERKQKFDFSTYRKDQVGFYVRNDSKIQAIREPKDVAGLRVVTDAGTNQEKILLAWDRETSRTG